MIDERQPWPKRLIKRMTSLVVSLLDSIVPKSPRLWVICSNGADVWHGNPQALYHRLVQDEDITCFVSGRGDEPGVESAFAVPRRSLRSLGLLLRAGVIVVHHGMTDIDWPGFRDRGRLIVNLWHAIKTKRTGLQLSSGVSLRDRQRFLRRWNDCSLVFASSSVDAVAIAGSFGLPLARTIVSGLPRNDWLLCPEDRLPEDVREALEDLRRRFDGRKIVLYAPTWRFNRSRSAMDEWRRTEEALTDLLERHDAVLVTRLHRKDGLGTASGSVSLPQRTFPQTMALLRYASLLITDYSSIWMDFLLTRKPIVLYSLDEEEFNNERGWLYEPPPLFPSARVTRSGDLVARVERALRDPAFLGMSQVDYEAAKRMFHAYDDGRSTERVFQAISRRVLPVRKTARTSEGTARS